MSIRTIAFIVVLPLLFIMMIDGWPVSQPLTEHECRTYFDSKVVNQQLQALLLCPKILRRPKSPLVHSIAKRSAKETIDANEDVVDEEFDDFYVFW